MNKKLITFLVSLFVIMSITVPAFAEGESKPHFVDNAGLVSSSYEASEINAKLYNLSEKNQFDIVIVTVENCVLEEISKYAGTDLWERPDADHSTVRFATSWATDINKITELAEILPVIRN